ncbi:MAG: hypothetical protein HYV07_00705 [Deltaproteobacteria bacterium]|nr:hypothetical protein [Deltaproteobacteria bacterium]
MKKNAIIATLVLVLGTVGFGLFGRSRADQLTYSCTFEAGPLCFAWKKNALGGFQDAAKGLLDDAKKAVDGEK